MLTRSTAGVVFAWFALAVTGCAAPKITDPLAELTRADGHERRQLAAIAMLDAQPRDPAYIEQLHALVWKPAYYTNEVREAAVERLAQVDLEGLKRTIRQRLPNMNAAMWRWLTRLSAIIAERGWTDLSPALVSSWARPTALVASENDRPEYQALARLHGPDHVVDVIFDLFVESNAVAQQGFRTRCWELMLRLGQRGRLVDLIRSAEFPPDDAMLLDLHAGASELGIIPANREEILWLRSLRAPERTEFWSDAVQAINALNAARRSELELRDLAIIVAAYRHEPELLERSRSELYARLESHLRDQRHHVPRTNYDNIRSGRERLHEFADVLTWGDLAAMLLAIRAVQSPGMVEHLFDFAERDRLDESTEYGGVLRLDSIGQFELVEFPPRIRHHDHKFLAPQEMFDAAYTSLFHFHYHVQRIRNTEFTGPGLGDINYADNTRANCLVFTSVGRDTLNMDFYRHGRVVVDLGEVKRRK